MDNGQSTLVNTEKRNKGGKTYDNYGVMPRINVKTTVSGPKQSRASLTKGDKDE